MRILTALLALALSSPLAAEPIRITGRVATEMGGLSGARLELFPAYEGYAEGVRRLTERRGPEPLAKAVTDEDGNFVIRAPESGSFRLEVRAEGYLAEEITILPLVEDTELPPTTLMRGSTVEVRTVGPDGRPLAGIEVRRLDASPWRWGWNRGIRFQTWTLISPIFTTDREGRASLAWFKPYGPPTVAAFSPRFLGQKAEGKPDEVLTLRLIPLQSWIEARGADGKPVAGVLARWNGWPVGITGPDGRLEVAVPGEDGALTLESREGLGARIARAEGKGILPVRLEPPRRLAGRVVDSLSRKPVAGALAWSGFPLVAPVVRADAEGGFSLDVPAGTEGWQEAGAAGFLPGERTLGKKGAQPVVLTLAPSAALSGKVVDKSGRPVDGVAVTLGYMKGTQGLQETARSHGDGGFRFPRLPPGGTFELTAVRTGFARTKATVWTAPAGQPSPLARIVMEDGQTAFGHVMDAGGRPVTGAAVRLSTERDAVLDALSDEEGRFEFRNLSPGRISVLATHPDHAPAFLSRVEIPSEKPAFDLGTLRLPPGEAIEGRVTDQRGAPIEGAAVWVHPAENRIPWMLVESSPEDPKPLRTAPDGTFRASNLEGGKRFHLQVEHPGYVQASVPGVEAPTREPLRIELKAARSLSGRVVGPEGEPVADAALDWFQSIGGGGHNITSLGASDAEGRFHVTGFPPGPLSLAVSAKGYVARQMEGIQIPGDRDPEDLQITLQRAITLEVQVLDAGGEPVPGARVHAEPVNPEVGVEDQLFFFSRFDQRGPDRTDASGRCQVRVAKRGSYWVSASRQGPPARVQVAVHSGSNAVEIRFPPATEVSGRVVDEKGATIARAAISLQQTPESQQRTWSAADGTFSFSDVPDGEYRLSASQERLTSEELSVAVAGQPIRGLELRLDRELPGAALTGHVLGLSPEELSGIVVRGLHAGEPGRSVSVDREGAYRFEKLPPGEWRLFAMDSEGRSAGGTVEIPAGVPAVELDLKFSTGLTLTGRVLMDGAPLSGAGVRAQGKKEEYLPGSQTAYDGTFKIRNLPAGPTTIIVSGPQGLGGIRNLILIESQTLQIELATGRAAGTVLSATGEPLEDVVVAMEAWIPALDVRYAKTVARTGPDGVFEIPRLGAGSYKVRISKEGFAPFETTAEVPARGSAPVAAVLKPLEEAP